MRAGPPAGRAGAPRETAGSRRVGALLLLGAAAGSAVYVAAVSLLARWPHLVRARGGGAAARPVLVGAVALPAAVLGVVWWRTSRGRRGAPLRRHAVAFACVGFGAAWVVWGVLEQHVLRTFDVAPGSGSAAAWDSLFHGVGVVTAGLGTSILSAGGATGGGT